MLMEPAMQETRHQRVRTSAREERLRATAGLRHAALPLTSWRGRSGRRYVVGVHPLSTTEVLDLTDAILLAVSRDGEGIARVVDVAAAGAAVGEQGLRWVRAVEAQGATEMHIHHLPDERDECVAVIDDLREAV